MKKHYYFSVNYTSINEEGFESSFIVKKVDMEQKISNVESEHGVSITGTVFAKDTSSAHLLVLARILEQVAEQ